MAEDVIRPSSKFIYAGFAVVLAVFIAALAVHYTYLDAKGQPPWLPGLALILFAWPLVRMLRRMFTKMTISADKLYYEAGALSKQTRIIQLPKVQDVRVHQTLGQRLMGVGDLSIETAGETSRLSVSNIDQPRALAEKLLELANHHAVPGARPVV